jgi:hypothetical protein
MVGVGVRGGVQFRSITFQTASVALPTRTANASRQKRLWAQRLATEFDLKSELESHAQQVGGDVSVEILVVALLD